MRLTLLSKLRIVLNSRKIFKNWYIFPLAYFRLIRNEFCIFESKFGLKLKIRVNSTDLMALTNVWLIHEYCIDKYNIQDDDIVIDVGAHIGLFALHITQECNRAKIFCFEPMPQNFDLLKFNINQNQLQNISAHNKAVSVNSTAKLFVNDDESAHSIITESSNSINVKSTTLQEIFDANNIASCKLLKLDCEGAEYEIIESLPLEYFKKIQNIVLEYHFADSKPDLSNALILKIKNAGFHVQIMPHDNDMGFLIASKK